jgi:hypothetical protein
MKIIKEKAILINWTIHHRSNHSHHYLVQLKLKQKMCKICTRKNLNYLLSFPRRSARIFIIFIVIVSCSPGLEPPCGETSDKGGRSAVF